MMIQQFRDVLHKQPFRPFRLHLADGRDVEVMHPDYVAQSPGGRTVIVYVDDDVTEFIDLLPVTSLNVGSRKKRGGNGRRN